MTLTNRLVRDLAWACFSPPLMITSEIADDLHNIANCGLELTPERQARLLALDADPSPLEAFLGHPLPRRLGLYFERLWQFFLTDDPSTDLLAHNLPVRDGSRTLGEFDCIYYCHHRRRTFHLELAVKYYLGWTEESESQDGASWSHWVGPNAVDRLDLKLRRLLDHQTRLAQTAQGIETLRAAGIGAPIAEAEIKGWLFSHSGMRLQGPRGYNAQRAMGTWVRHLELPEFLESHTAISWRFLKRQEWLAPATEDSSALDSAALLAILNSHFEQQSRPVQLAQLVGNSAGMLEEASRVFVVSESWPEYDREKRER